MLPQGDVSGDECVTWEERKAGWQVFVVVFACVIAGKYSSYLGKSLGRTQRRSAWRRLAYSRRGANHVRQVPAASGVPNLDERAIVACWLSSRLIRLPLGPRNGPGRTWA